MRNSAYLYFGFVLAIGACKPDRLRVSADSMSAKQVSGSDNLTCGSGGSLPDLVYTDITTDSSTDDQSGLQFTLKRHPDGWSGEVREAVGQLGGPRNLIELQLSGRDHLSFGFVKGSDTARFDGRISCDSIWGRWTPFPSIIQERKVFARK
jgi:hypothetical protein